MSVVLDMDLYKLNDMLAPILSTSNHLRIHQQNDSQAVRRSTTGTSRHLHVINAEKVAMYVLDQMILIEPNVGIVGRLMTKIYESVRMDSFPYFQTSGFATSAQMNVLLALQTPMIIVSYEM